MKKLIGKVAVVTGASKGIGASIAIHLAAEGAKVVVGYSSSKDGADKVVASIVDNGGSAIAVSANVANKAEVENLFEQTIQHFGRLDILVNNAGVYDFLPIESLSEENFHRTFNINVWGLLLTSQTAVPHFDQQGGSIINISSVVSTSPIAGASVYSGSKAAVDAITRSLARELGNRKIRVNALSPGMIETEGAHSAGIIGSDLQKQVVAGTALGRIGQPEDIGKVATFLASEDAAWVTGEALVASGGHQ
ncbi:MAG TPA: glucose 1-dehydrogenase [Arachidicoccus sp.]|nr:glucose 1-dehydrogenase [Arachidicoccus sp.]